MGYTLEPENLLTRILRADMLNMFREPSQVPCVAPSRADVFNAQFDHLRGLPDNWDGYGAERPNNWALTKGHEVIEVFMELDLHPSAIAPCANGGIEICFRRHGKFADFQCCNSGSLLGLTSDPSGHIKVFRMQPGEIRAGIKKIQDFIER